MKVPIIQCHAEAADQAFAAHTALLQAERADPKLIANPYWQALRDAAYARFRASFSRAD